MCLVVLVMLIYLVFQEPFTLHLNIQEVVKVLLMGFMNWMRLVLIIWNSKTLVIPLC